MEAPGQPTATPNVAPVTDAPATETTSPAFDALAYLNDPTRANLKAAYWNKNDPGHEAAVQHVQGQFALHQKQADAAALEAMGGKDAVPEGEQTATVELPPARAGQEWDEGAATQAISIAEQAGVPTEVIQAAVEFIGKHGSPPMSAEEGEQALRKIVGDAYEDTLADANAILDEFPTLKKWVIGSGFANDPALIQLLAQERGLRGDVQQQINELSASDAYRQGGHPKHDETVERVRLLYKKLYA